MQRSSESIGRLATALAKAQAELVNPEKSLVATISQTARAAPGNRFATRRYQVGWRLCARRWASMRSLLCRPRQSIRPPG